MTVPLGLLFLVIIALAAAVFFKNRMLSIKLKETRQLLSSWQYDEKNKNKLLSKSLHDKLQGDLVAAKYLIHIYSQVKDENKKAEILNDISKAIEASVENSKRLSDKIKPPLLESDGCHKALKHYFETMGQSTGKLFLISGSDPDFMLPAEKEYQLFRIIEMLCDFIVEKGTATQVRLAFSDQEIELTDNGEYFNPDLENPSPESLLLSLPLRLKILNALLKQQPTEKGNHFILTILINNHDKSCFS